MALDPLIVAGVAATLLGVGTPIGIAIRRRRVAPLMLCCIDGVLRNYSVELTADVLRIGRSADSDLHLPDASASRRHAEMLREGSGVRLRDLGSSDGVWSDGGRIFEALLQPGDQFQIGAHVFALLRAGDASPAVRVHRRLDGEVLSLEKFEIEELLYSGAHFTIMRARRRDDAQGEVVAVKFLNQVGVQHELMRGRFDAYLQAAVAQSAAHPALVRVLGGSAVAVRPYVIQSFAAGLSLSKRIAGITMIEARRIFAQLCDIVEQLHEQGLHHGALDASDVLFVEDGSVRLANVGCARVFGETTTSMRDDIAGLAVLGELLCGGGVRRMHAHTVADLRERWKIMRMRCHVEDVQCSGFRPLRLHILQTGHAVAVSSNPYLLGRVLNPADRSLSREHAELCFDHNVWMLRAVGNRGASIILNGASLDGSQPIVVGDELRLGDTTLRITE